jgi:hypothetical protein
MTIWKPSPPRAGWLVAEVINRFECILLAGRGRGDRARPALDEAHAQAFLQEAHHLTDPRRRQAQPLRRLGETLLLEHRDQRRRAGKPGTGRRAASFFRIST